MGVIFLALVAYGKVNPDDGIPIWVKLCCALAIALGTYIGGWRVIRTLGKGLVEIESPQGMAAEMASAAVILTSSHFGIALSTTHVSTGSILGTGLGRKGAEVRWGVAGRMVIAWVITLPAAAIVGALTWLIGHYVGLHNELLGVIVVFAVLVATAGYIFHHSRKTPVNAENVNDDWDAHNPTQLNDNNGKAPKDRKSHKLGKDSKQGTVAATPATTLDPTTTVSTDSVTNAPVAEAVAETLHTPQQGGQR